MISNVQYVAFRQANNASIEASVRQKSTKQPKRGNRRRGARPPLETITTGTLIVTRESSAVSSNVCVPPPDSPLTPTRFRSTPVCLLPHDLHRVVIAENVDRQHAISHAGERRTTCLHAMQKRPEHSKSASFSIRG
jgi:hypothetical protein